MALLQLTSENLSQTITESPMVVVDFWASWCGPCMRFAPVFEKAADKHPEITFGKVDTEANQELASSLSITSIPTLMVFKDGVLLYRDAGALNAAQFEDLLTQLHDIDMDAVRAEMADEPSPAQQA